ncbi:hypothetical protein Srufu_002610 [Streptomyces libani subsp. rufus]|nr:hypothetical protein Srufu_002610 [Streptomyces libani subsp. rufus]
MGQMMNSDTRGGREFCGATGYGFPPESRLRAEDIARSVVFMVTQPPHVTINELTVRPTAQER